MTKVAFLFLSPLTSDNPDFLFRVPIRMAKILGESGEVHVIYSGDLSDDLLKEAGIRVHRFRNALSNLPVLKYLAPAIAARSIALREHLDSISNVWGHFRLIPIAWALIGCSTALVGRVAGTPVGLVPPTGSRARIRRRLGLWIERWSLLSCDQVHVLSESLFTTMRKRGVPGSRMTVISTGCDTDSFRPRGWRWPKGEAPRLLFVGRLVETKGVSEALRAVTLLRSRGLDARLTIAGDGPLRRSIETEVGDPPADSAVYVRGYVPHDKLPSLFRQADFLVLPSASEGLPNVVMEAMSSGIPVVASDMPSTRMLLGEGRGTLCSPQAEEIADAITRLWNDPEAAVGIARRAREFVVRHHGLRVVKDRYLRLYAGTEG